MDEIRRNLPKPEDRQLVDSQLASTEQQPTSEQQTFDLTSNNLGQQIKQFSISDDKKINKFMYKIE